MGSQMSSPLTTATTETPAAGTPVSTKDNMAALRTFTEARVACSNSVAELDALNAMTSRWDWNCSNEAVEGAAVDLQLQCECAAKEATAIHEILTGFANCGDVPAWLWVELEVRQENGATAAKQIISTIEELAAAVAKPDMALKEMRRRAQLILPKLEGLKVSLNDLQAHMQEEHVSAPVAPAQQKQS